MRDKINKLLFSIFEDEDVIKYWLSTIGLAFFTNKFESLYIHTGNGRNGKGVLSEILKLAFGEYYYQSDNNLLTGEVKSNTNSTLVKARYARLLVISEPDDSSKEYKLKTSLVKQITGNDDITVRDLYKSNITYKPMFTVILQCNKKPSIDRVDKAMEERLKVIHYPFTFVDNPKLETERLRDYSLKDMINKDINFIKEFVLLLLESAFNSYKLQNIKLPSKIVQKNNEYFNENNPIKEFLSDKFDITNNNKDKIKASILFSLFRDDESMPDLSITKIGEGLDLNNIKKIKERDGIYYVGLKLK
jgi:putative DNA primase/helicase